MRTHALVLAGLLCVLAGCGRLGVELFAARDAGVMHPEDAGVMRRDAGVMRQDAGAMRDAGGSERDAGKLSDAGLDGSAYAGDSGGVDANTGCPTACAYDHGAADCSTGVCHLTCASGYADCDGTVSNGCEIDLNASVQACGGCGTPCSNANGTTRCVAGACTPVCSVGHADCDAQTNNGCEASLATDPVNCGGCGVTCDTSFQACINGSCQVSMCPQGRGDCDAVSSDCETDLTSSVNNCGACDTTCTAAHATPRCLTSACGIASCNSGFADCDATAANGCEVGLLTDALNCGSCAAPCSNAHGSTSCAAGACVPVCSGAWKSCDGNLRNGCETATDSITNCGGCGTVCPNAMSGASAVCNAGVCGYACNSLSGVYALRLDAPASWSAKPFILAGSGTLQFWLRLTLTQSGTALTGSAQLCDEVTPEERNNATTDRYVLSYPSAAFTPGAPGAAFSATLASRAPGAGLTSALAAHVVGISLSDPLNGAWPAVTAARNSQVDHDADGKVGMTVVFVDDATHNHAQTDATLVAARASHAYGAQRLRFSLGGALTACSGASGSATIQSFDTRTIGCRLESGTDCSTSQYTYIDDNTVSYSVGSATYTLTRLGATGSSFTCAQVRAAL